LQRTFYFCCARLFKLRTNTPAFPFLPQIRYVALNTLGKVVLQDSAAVQRHRNTIVDCLKDPDISIRIRALDLIFKLVTKDNVEALTAELLNYLVISPAENRAEVCTKVLKVVDQFAPSPRWQVDTLITLLTIAGKDCKDSVLAATVSYIARSTEELRGYCTHKLVKAMRDDDGTQEGLLIVGIWCVGEFGETLLQPYSEGAGADSVSFSALDPLDVIKLVDDITRHVLCSNNLKQRALTCFAKLTDRFSNCDPAVVTKLKLLIKKFEGSMSLELQLRSCEYSVLVGGVGAGALARMPVVDPAVAARKSALSVMNGSGSGGADLFDVGGGEADSAAQGSSQSLGLSAPVKAAGGDLLDLDDIFGGGGGSASSAPVSAASAAQPAVQSTPSSDADLLSDIFASTPLPSAAPAAAPPAPAMSNNLLDPFASQPPAAPMANNAPSDAGAVLDIFSAPPAPVPAPAPAAPAAAAGNPIVPGYNQDGLEIKFECKPGEVVALFSNHLGQDMTGLVFQAAVPKYLTMSMEPPSSTTIKCNGGNSVTQSIKITNSMVGTKKVMMKLKISYMVNGQKVEAQATANQFPAGY
jgi:AP-1 complex subunit gamma-1